MVVDRLHLRFVEPLDTFAVLPKSKLNFIILRDNISSKPMLLPFVPVAFVAALVSPSVDSKSVLLVVLVLAAIHATIVPDVDTHPLHVVVEPFSLVLAAI